MKIVVYAHSMEIGGSQLNAIEIGAAVQRLGHEVILVGEPGPLAETALQLGLEHREIPERRRRPSPAVLKLLLELVAKRGVQVVHGYEWPPALEAWLGPQLLRGTAVVGTVMSAAVADFLPRSLPLVVGTDELRRRCLADGFDFVELLEPPVDVHANSPAFDGSAFRASLGLAPDVPLVVVVCRLVRELKREGLLVACRTIGALAREGTPVALAIVGDGAARAEIEAEATRANALAGRRVVTLTGELADPRPAYAAADVMLGMGGSALRGMAFQKPLIVQGELGYWQVCDEQSVEIFLEGGWYGLGDAGDGVARLRSQLLPLLTDATRRAALGKFSRELVVQRFSLERAARTQLDIYERVLARPRLRSAREIGRTGALLGWYKVQRRWQRWTGRAAADDFNAIARMRAAERAR
jgi:glycosyltransferase involved in cell wall biosynthesis